MIEISVSKDICARIEGIEKDLNHVPSFEYIDSKIKEEIDGIMEIFKCNWAAAQSQKSVKPYKCPVCDGKVLTEIKIQKTQGGIGKLVLECHGCEGKGIVWG